LFRPIGHTLTQKLIAAWDCEPTSEQCRSLSPRPALFHAAPASPGWGRIFRTFKRQRSCQLTFAKRGSFPTSNRPSIAACHSGVSCSPFGSLVMQVPASCRSRSWRRQEGSIGSSKGRFQPLPRGISWLSRASNQPTRAAKNHFQWQGRYMASSCLPRRKIMRGVKPP